MEEFKSPTVGKDDAAPLAMVIPLAEMDSSMGFCCMGDGGFDDDDSVAVEGSEKQPSNSVLARKGCHGGNAGSGTMEKTSVKSSEDSSLLSDDAN